MKKNQVKELIINYASTFVLHNLELGKFNTITYKIVLTHNKPVSKKYKLFPANQWPGVKSYFESNLKPGIIH